MVKHGFIGRVTTWLLVLLVALPLVATGKTCGAPEASGKATGGSVEVLADSSNFVHASLLVAAPADAIYSVFGHCALRMECPSERLDYIFSLEADAGVGDYLKFFAGRAMARVVAVPTAEYLSLYAEEGRSVRAYELNLTHHEKQRLWQLLDEEMVRPPHLRFNLIDTNCVMLCMVMLEQSLIGERLDFGQLPAPMSLDDGSLLRYHARRSPWAEFLFITFAGAACDGRRALEYRLSPEMIIEILQKSALISQHGDVRPVLKGRDVMLLPQVRKETVAVLTPLLAACGLLLLVFIVTIGEWVRGWRRLPRCVDGAFLFLQTLVGLVLLFAAIVSNLFGTRWNWYLIPFNPLPLLLWLCCRCRGWYPRVYGCYAAVLLLFVAATPLSSQLDLEHALVALSLAVRCLSRWLACRFPQRLLSSYKLLF